MDTLVSLCKRRGFIFPGSEIYGGLANSWDYGPYGVELKNNLKRAWWRYWVERRDDIVGLDSAILMNPAVWEASGHVANFADPLVDCKRCNARHRGDKLIEEKKGASHAAGIALTDVAPILRSEKIPCPSCGAIDWAEAKKFNLMFKTYQGAAEENGREVYLRPETAQGIFVNFKNVQSTTRKRLPFGIAQIGKAFRNEITPGNFIFRMREFEQMEIEYFTAPSKWEKEYAKLEEASMKFFLDIGIAKENLRWRKHEKNELSHYSSLTKDIEYRFPWDWGELLGLAYRGDYDLRQHQEHSGENLEYTDPKTGEKFLPHCIEPSFGCDRTVLVALLDAYHEEDASTAEEGEKEKRVVMRFEPRIAPVTVAVLPLSKNEKLSPLARQVYDSVRAAFRCEYDETQSIGKRYRRQDEIGTPYCVTVDFDSLKDNCVTVRVRDTMEQERIAIPELAAYLQEKYSS